MLIHVVAMREVKATRDSRESAPGVESVCDDDFTSHLVDGRDQAADLGRHIVHVEDRWVRVEADGLGTKTGRSARTVYTDQ
jgi:hypothetical protein